MNSADTRLISQGLGWALRFCLKIEVCIPFILADGARQRVEHEVILVVAATILVNNLVEGFLMMRSGLKAYAYAVAAGVPIIGGNAFMLYWWYFKGFLEGPIALYGVGTTICIISIYIAISRCLSVWSDLPSRSVGGLLKSGNSQ
jgi:hypothetical protein